MSRQAQPDVASPTAISATAARKVDTGVASRPACVFVVASIETSVHVLVECERLLIQLLATPQPKASANSNAEPGNAGLNLPPRGYRLPAVASEFTSRKAPDVDAAEARSAACADVGLWCQSLGAHATMAG